MKPKKPSLFSCWLLILLCLPILADADWRKVDLPHDWSIEVDFDANAPSGNDGGYVLTGIGWYRNTFSVDKSMEGKSHGCD